MCIVYTAHIHIKEFKTLIKKWKKVALQLEMLRIISSRLHLSVKFIFITKMTFKIREKACQILQRSDLIIFKNQIIITGKF